jgi:hypothetical protein
MRTCGTDDEAVNRALRPRDAGIVRVDRLEVLPSALMRLARLVAQSGHLQPLTVRRIAAEHARTVLTLADLLGRRDSVAGATAPALLGVPTEMRAHANTLATVRTTVRDLHSSADDDPRVTQQLYALRRRLRAEERRMTRRLTDPDLHTVVASLRPAIWLAPALRCAITRQLNAGAWLHRARDRSWQHATTTSVPHVVDAALVARESALRLMDSLPPPPPVAGSVNRSLHHGHAPTPTWRGTSLSEGVGGVQLA